MRVPLVVTTVAEGATGIVLLLFPSFMFRLLISGGMTVGDGVLASVCGVALVTISLACWPHPATPSGWGQQRLAMIVYNAAVALLFAAFGAAGAATGPLLWPVAIFHGLMAAWLAAPIRRTSGLST